MALIAGGLVLNASLFNGARVCLPAPRFPLTSKQLMVVTVLSNTPGSRLCIVTSCPLLMARNRLHGIGDEVYLEGTHLMVPSTLGFVDVVNPNP